jgi:addiction module RelE/StbE family toxin
VAQVEWSDAAIAGVAEIRAYIAEENPDAAARIAKDLVQAADSLDSLPLRGAPVIGGRRKLVVDSKYLIFYQVSADREHVNILAVIDGRRVRQI